MSSSLTAPMSDWLEEKLAPGSWRVEPPVEHPEFIRLCDSLDHEWEYDRGGMTSWRIHVKHCEHGPFQGCETHMFIAERRDLVGFHLGFRTHPVMSDTASSIAWQLPAMYAFELDDDGEPAMFPDDKTARDAGHGFLFGDKDMVARLHVSSNAPKIKSAHPPRDLYHGFHGPADQVLAVAYRIFEMYDRIHRQAQKDSEDMILTEGRIDKDHPIFAGLAESIADQATRNALAAQALACHGYR